MSGISPEQMRTLVERGVGIPFVCIETADGNYVIAPEICVFTKDTLADKTMAIPQMNEVCKNLRAAESSMADRVKDLEKYETFYNLYKGLRGGR